jgi:hypothetical protein
MLYLTQLIPRNKVKVQLAVKKPEKITRCSLVHDTKSVENPLMPAKFGG